MKRIWVDTDVALGGPRGDVDDGFALAAVALAEVALPQDVQLAGVSVVSGNTDALTARRAARDLLDELGGRFRNVSVVGEGEAPRALIERARDTSIVAIGPPTNLVQAAALDPAWCSTVEVRAVGTVNNKVRNPILPLFCLNFRTDPKASKRFFELDWGARKIFPLDVVRRLRFGRADLRRIASTGTLGAYLSKHSQRWLRRTPLRYQSRSFPVWDLVAALDAIGHLPSAVFDGERLQTFDVSAASRRFLGLLDAAATPAPARRSTSL